MVTNSQMSSIKESKCVVYSEKKK